MLTFEGGFAPPSYAAIHQQPERWMRVDWSTLGDYSVAIFRDAVFWTGWLFFQSLSLAFVRVPDDTPGAPAEASHISVHGTQHGMGHLLRLILKDEYKN